MGGHVKFFTTLISVLCIGVLLTFQVLNWRLSYIYWYDYYQTCFSKDGVLDLSEH